ncbi:MAG: glutamate-5-semialdehyde dehydrogenase [Rhodospirillales bacterium]|nr:glutamate-5-semialdehyde dehydrogenase [Alphaproteobacteria bacterium]USO03230.1 MAG: glutamate-5-semialdehyde dehydrogenase [Rhodospirillales bacterium]
MTYTNLIHDLGAQAKKSAFILAQTDTPAINGALRTLAEKLRDNHNTILEANQKDVDAARAKELSSALIDRLTLTPERIEAIAQGVESIAQLDDPVGTILEETVRPNGLRIQKVSVPIGVLGMIYESRPNVTVDAAALCLKSHNAVILRGGSESLNSSKALHTLIQEALKAHDIPEGAVCLVPDCDRAHVGDMLRAHDFIDVMIPRGGRGLTSRVMNEATMPVFAHLDGNCHVYVHESANPALAKEVILNAKLRRTGICGAAESLLLDEKLSCETAAGILAVLLDAGCAVAGDAESCGLDKRITPASEEDWATEYLDARISCKFVKDVREAAVHINRYGSHHTDSILAEDKAAADYFLKNVDSAIVMHNTSTQFADGGEFGMGAEIGIGTGKLHARGPVGVKQLTTFKYLVHGNGQTRP